MGVTVQKLLGRVMVPLIVVGVMAAAPAASFAAQAAQS